jgi:hypothetical protein
MRSRIRFIGLNVATGQSVWGACLERCVSVMLYRECIQLGRIRRELRERSNQDPSISGEPPVFLPIVGICGNCPDYLKFQCTMVKQAKLSYKCTVEYKMYCTELGQNKYE